MRKPFIALLLTCGIALNAWAEPIGRVLVAVGDVSVQRQGRSQPLPTGATVESGDMLSTGANSNVQVRFQDESLVALRANSQFRIDDYHFVNAEKGGASIMSLLRGGFRTITGLIGKVSRDKYEVHTVTSTIGIRGTHYNVVSCDGDCRNGDGSLAPNGTYGTVTEGAISVTNSAGQLDVGNDGYFYVASASTAPVPLMAPPPFLFDRLDGQARRSIPSVDLARGMGGQEVSDQGGIVADGRIGFPETPSAAPLLATASPVVSGEMLSGATGQSALLSNFGINFLYADLTTNNISAVSGEDISQYGGPSATTVSALNAAFAAQGQTVNTVAMGTTSAYWTYIPPGGGTNGQFYLWGDAPVPASLPTASVTFNPVFASARDTSGNVVGMTLPSMSVNFTGKTVSALGNITLGSYTILSSQIQGLTLNGAHSVQVTCGTCATSVLFNGTLLGINGQGLAVDVGIRGGPGNVAGIGLLVR